MPPACPEQSSLAAELPYRQAIVTEMNRALCTLPSRRIVLWHSGGIRIARRRHTLDTTALGGAAPPLPPEGVCWPCPPSTAREGVGQQG